MRALVQRVSRAAVRVDGETVGAIGAGLLVLLGIAHADDEALGEERAVLVVSQFTLYGDARKGNRPSYVAAARPEQAEPLYERFADRLGAARGVFGAMMEVELVNDGPVTLMLELA